MPDEEDFAGAALEDEPALSVLLFLALCFLWVDFMEPFSLPALLADVELEAGADEACEALSCAKAAPLMMVQPASRARISFVLRMTNLSLELLLAPWDS